MIEGVNQQGHNKHEIHAEEKNKYLFCLQKVQSQGMNNKNNQNQPQR